MKVKLRITKGSNAGQELKIPTPKCVIGRDEGCHLRPKSDAISRRHCVLYVKSGSLIVRDLQSKNGTFVNGERVEGDRTLSSGDAIQFGPLAFEVVIDHSLGGEKKPKVTSVKEAAARTTAVMQPGAVDDGDISDWLEEADQEAILRRRDDPETRQLKLDDTDQVSLQKRNEPEASDEAAESEASAEAPSGRPKGKKVFGKLPQQPDAETKDSREAAAEMLKKFFNKR